MKKVKVGDLVYCHYVNEIDNGSLEKVHKVTGKYIHLDGNFMKFYKETGVDKEFGYWRIKTLDELPEDFAKGVVHKYKANRLARTDWYELDPKLVDQVIRLCEGWSKTSVLYGNDNF